MSAGYISAELRRIVEVRAEGLCEYCLIDQESSFLGHQVDHIISEKHGGRTEASNLAAACACCNRAKGSDIGSIYWESSEFISRWIKFLGNGLPCHTSSTSFTCWP